MNQTAVRLTLILFLSIPMISLHAQIKKKKLVPGTFISAEIKSGEKHQYTIQLDKDQFAFLKLMHQGIDLAVTTYNGLDEKIGDFDRPNYRDGYELFTITSTEKGVYTIEVHSIDEEDHSGNYEIFIENIKPKATTASGEVDQLFTVWDSDDTPGAAVAIVKDGKIRYKKGYGMANLEYDIPVSPASVFHIASVSKQFTVFSILLLENQGKLSLDDVITKEHVLKLVSRQKDLNFEPGEEYLYCNTGFTLLAEVVARVAEMSFAEFTEANIFEPLKMNSTLFYDDHEKIVKNRAYSYYSSKEGYKKSVLSYANVGATSLFTTVEDLSLWAMNFSDVKVGNESLINKMNTLEKLNNGETFGGALGQFVGEYKGLKEIQHISLHQI